LLCREDLLGADVVVLDLDDRLPPEPGGVLDQVDIRVPCTVEDGVEPIVLGDG
jgi:hypothetical protein